jgi:hypothetical protein
MDRLGDATLKPFLQDVIQLKPLVQTLSKQASGTGLYFRRRCVPMQSAPAALRHARAS